MRIMSGSSYRTSTLLPKGKSTPMARTASPSVVKFGDFFARDISTGRKLTQQNDHDHRYIVAQAPAEVLPDRPISVVVDRISRNGNQDGETERMTIELEVDADGIVNGWSLFAGPFGPWPRA